MIKLLHTSDWHIGRVLHERSLLEDQWHALQQIITILKEDPHDLLIVAGDIYDRSLPSAEAVALLSRFLTELRGALPIPVVMIPGNHDSALRLSYCAGMLSISGIHIITDAGRAHEPVRISAGAEAVNIYAIPFLEPGVFDTHGEDEEAGKGSHEKALEYVLDTINGTMDAKSVNICTAHLYARRGLTSDSERIMVGGAGDVDPSLFNAFTYTALGHLHRPQSVSGKVRYSGSLLKYSFSECDDAKGVLSVTLTDEVQDVVSIPLVPLRDMVRIRGSFQSLLNGREFAEYRHHYVEAELTDGGIIMNPLVSLRERFPHILSVRQAAPEEKTGKGGEALPLSGKGTVEDDYRAFHACIHGEAPSREKLELFEKIRGERGSL